MNAGPFGKLESFLLLDPQDTFENPNSHLYRGDQVLSCASDMM